MSATTLLATTLHPHVADRKARRESFAKKSGEARRKPTMVQKYSCDINAINRWRSAPKGASRVSNQMQKPDENSHLNRHRSGSILEPIETFLHQRMNSPEKKVSKSLTQRNWKRCQVQPDPPASGHPFSHANSFAAAKKFQPVQFLKYQIGRRKFFAVLKRRTLAFEYSMSNESTDIYRITVTHRRSMSAFTVTTVRSVCFPHPRRNPQRAASGAPFRACRLELAARAFKA